MYSSVGGAASPGTVSASAACLAPAFGFGVLPAATVSAASGALTLLMAGGISSAAAAAATAAMPQLVS